MTWHKSRPIALAPDIGIDEAFAIVATACRDHWDANFAAAVAGHHPEGVHQFRVGLRRFRTALTLFRDYLPATQRDWLKAEAKTLSDLLSPARDLDVFLTDLALPLSARAASDPQVAAMMRAARDARRTAHDRIASALTAKRYRRFMTRLNVWLTGKGWQKVHRAAANGDQPAKAFARATLNRRLAKIQKRAKTMAANKPAELHALRISIKKLRYGFEFFESLLPARRATRIGRLLKALQDSLGRLNDVDVAARTLGTLSAEAKSGEAREAVDHAGIRLTANFKPLIKTALPEANRVAARLRAQKLL